LTWGYLIALVTSAPPPITRQVAIRVCAVCERQRTGAAAPGWPADVTVCPRCSDIAWKAIEQGLDQLAPRRVAS
jgi:hypothetical protein